MIGGVLKIVATDPDDCKCKVYDLGTDPAETTDHSPDRPYRTVRLRAASKAWCASMQASPVGKDRLGWDFDPRESRPSRWMTRTGCAQHIGRDFGN